MPFPQNLLTKIADNNPSLEELRIIDYCITSQEIVNILAALKSNTTLKRIILSSRQLPEQANQAFWSIIATKTSIEEIKLEVPKNTPCSNLYENLCNQYPALRSKILTFSIEVKPPYLIQSLPYPRDFTQQVGFTDEVILRIFNFLDWEDILRIALVNKNWKRLARDGQLLKCFYERYPERFNQGKLLYYLLLDAHRRHIPHSPIAQWTFSPLAQYLIDVYGVTPPEEADLVEGFNYLIREIIDNPHAEDKRLESQLSQLRRDYLSPIQPHFYLAKLSEFASLLVDKYDIHKKTFTSLTHEEYVHLFFLASMSQRFESVFKTLFMYYLIQTALARAGFFKITKDNFYIVEDILLNANCNQLITGQGLLVLDSYFTDLIKRLLICLWSNSEAYLKTEGQLATEDTKAQQAAAESLLNRLTPADLKQWADNFLGYSAETIRLCILALARTIEYKCATGLNKLTEPFLLDLFHIPSQNRKEILLGMQFLASLVLTNNYLLCQLSAETLFYAARWLHDTDLEKIVENPLFFKKWRGNLSIRLLDNHEQTLDVRLAAKIILECPNALAQLTDKEILSVIQKIGIMTKALCISFLDKPHFLERMTDELLLELASNSIYSSVWAKAIVQRSNAIERLTGKSIVKLIKKWNVIIGELSTLRVIEKILDAEDIFILIKDLRGEIVPLLQQRKILLDKLSFVQLNNLKKEFKYYEYDIRDGYKNEQMLFRLLNMQIRSKSSKSHYNNISTKQPAIYMHSDDIGFSKTNLTPHTEPACPQTKIDCFVKTQELENFSSYPNLKHEATKGALNIIGWVLLIGFAVGLFTLSFTVPLPAYISVLFIGISLLLLAISPVLRTGDIICLIKGNASTCAYDDIKAPYTKLSQQMGHQSTAAFPDTTSKEASANKHYPPVLQTTSTIASVVDSQHLNRTQLVPRTII